MSRVIRSESRAFETRYWRRDGPTARRTNALILSELEIHDRLPTVCQRCIIQNLVMCAVMSKFEKLVDGKMGGERSKRRVQTQIKSNISHEGVLKVPQEYETTV